MTKIKIKIEATEYFFKLIGFNTALKAYRISYILNTVLNIKLVKTFNFELDLKKKEEKYSFEFFKDENNETKYYLFGNKTIGKELFRTYKGFDYVLLIKKDTEIENIDDIVDKLKQTKKIKIVLSANNIKKIDETFVKKQILYRDFDEENKKKLNENSKQ